MKTGNKRFIALMCAVLILVGLVGCGEKSPIEKAQAKAVEIGEQYLDFEITAKEAKEMLNSIKVPETDGYGQSYLEADISALSFNIAYGDSYEDIAERVDRIASKNYTD